MSWGFQEEQLRPLHVNSITLTILCAHLIFMVVSSVAKRSCTLELLPPTSDAFMLHVKRPVYQAVIWGQSLATQPKIYNTTDKCLHIWMTKPEVSLVLSEFIHCKHNEGCTGRCKCVKANLICTALCGCDGECV